MPSTGGRLPSLRASPGARRYYDQLRGRGKAHSAALRQLGNRLVGILYGCLKTGTRSNEHTAWGHHPAAARASRRLTPIPGKGTPRV